MKQEVKKPPLGLVQKNIAKELNGYNDIKRVHDIEGAVKRYFNASVPVPMQWIEEYNELVIKLNPPLFNE